MRASGYVDGQVGRLDEMRVSVLDRGFLYGDSIYEVFRTYSGIPFMFDAHYERLMNSARLSMMRVEQSKEDIVRAIKATIAVAEVGAGEDVWVRCQISRGGGEVELYPRAGLRSRMVIMVKEVPQWPVVFRERGMRLAVPMRRRNAANTLDPNIKGGNYLNNILGLAEARALGADDCVMLDADGFVTECSNSNVWFVLEGELVTPARGNLLGLTRKALVGLLEGAGYSGSERAVHGDVLGRVTECFVSSATREVMAVVSLRLGGGEQVRFAAGGGEMTRMAMRLYAEMLAEFVREHRGEAWF